MATFVDANSSVSDDAALLGEDVPETPEKVETPPESDDEPSPLEPETTDEETLEETPEENVEEPPKKELLPHERPSLAQIKEKFPEFFKEFPQLKDVIYREKEFATLFPSIDDAHAASESAELFADLRNDVTQGDGKKFLDSLKEAESLPKFAENFLPQLQKLDQEVYWTTVSPVLEHAVRAFYNQGKIKSSEDMVNAANHLAVFLFGDVDYASGKKTFSKPEEKKDESVKNEREQWNRERLVAFDNEIQTGIRSGLVSQISVGLPKEGLTTFMKNAITDKIIAEVDKQIASDNTHVAFVKKLWDKAKGSGFGSDSKDSIKNAYLSRAKSLIPSIRRRLLSEALGTSFVEKTKVEEIEKINSRREPGSGGRAPESVAKVPTAKQVDWKKTSDLDLLNDNVTLKRK